MKNIALLLAFTVGALSLYAQTDPFEDPAAFITTWQDEQDDFSIRIPAEGRGYNYKVSWASIEEGAAVTHVADPQTGDYTIAFPNAGTYKVAITGTFPTIYFRGQTKLRTVEQWGTTQWTSMFEAFSYCSALNSLPEDGPDLSKVTSMERMFGGQAALAGTCPNGT